MRVSPAELRAMGSKLRFHCAALRAHLCVEGAAGEEVAKLGVRPADLPHLGWKQRKRRQQPWQHGGSGLALRGRKEENPMGGDTHRPRVSCQVRHVRPAVASHVKDLDHPVAAARGQALV